MATQRPIDVVFLHADDNVCVAARPLECDAPIAAGGRNLCTVEPIKQGHKIALTRIEAGEPAIKYGQVIGFATETIAPGQWVHTHNLAAGQFQRDYAPCSRVPADPAPLEGYTFQGYRRSGGRAGTRNYVALISSVNCSASVCKHVARRFDAASLRDFPNVDGVLAFTHGGGCGLEWGGVQHRLFNRGQGAWPNIPTSAPTCWSAWVASRPRSAG